MLKLKAMCVIVNPEFPEERLSYIANHTRCKAILTDDCFEEKARKLELPIITIPSSWPDGPAPGLETTSEPSNIPHTARDGTVVTFTSGNNELGKSLRVLRANYLSITSSLVSTLEDEDLEFVSTLIFVGEATNPEAVMRLDKNGRNVIVNYGCSEANTILETNVLIKGRELFFLGSNTPGAIGELISESCTAPSGLMTEDGLGGDCFISPPSWRANYPASEWHNVKAAVDSPVLHKSFFVSGGSQWNPEGNDACLDTGQLTKSLLSTNGYGQSKLIAEQLVARTAPATQDDTLGFATLKPGLVIGSQSNGGIANTDDLLWRLVKACVLLGAYCEEGNG
ncbi:acetyl-CoA synthetase-like protein [Penicillium longicatenatum]|uniref:acetyl-CoA synthetase-like protein n=1 Tax=Penicillium longicatenatum TaxID=1561947 RepID=UPI0025495668|nr:acetyl-CoA synthetase-like protein [Penicillium longicatenatum]KAJ5660991.1 acetyl-CoA synthetase-like protein [Penicillium longicatenatum]